MNHFVPEFDMDVDYSIPSSSGHHRQEDEILELLWQNGQVVVQSQNPRLHRKPSPPPPPPKFPHHHQQQQEQQKHHPPPPLPSQLAAPPPDSDSNTQQLFIQEDEMNSWLEYPSFDRDLADLLYIPPGQPPPPSVALRPPPPPPPPPPLPPVPQPHHHHHNQSQTQALPPRPEAPATDVNFRTTQVSRTTTTRFPDSGPSTSSRNNEVRETTVVDSSDTPAVRHKPKILLAARNAVEISDRGNRCREIGAASTAGGASMNISREIDTCDLTQSPSPGGSGVGASLSLSATATADLMTLQPADDRKRKGREPVDEVNAEYQSEDVEIESYEPKKQSRGSANKRSRAAEVHNLSERRRRDRINEKMKVLQELIPRSSKTDKASMLDEAIDYLKSLQMQVQMMSMGCGMVPVMFPGVQQYMGMGMGMGMGMEMGMTRPMMPFPGVLPGSALPTPGAPSHLSPRFPLQAFPTPGDASVNPGHSMGMIPGLADAYQQCMNMQQMPIPITPQNQQTRQPSISKQSAHRGGEVHEKPPAG